MPTGYTHIIGEGATFEQYVWHCARGFGACVSLRDSNAEIPEKFEPSDFYKIKIEETKKQLSELSQLSSEEIKHRARQAYSTEMNERNDQVTKRLELKARYQTMLEDVMAWNPPTPDHNELKDFMIEQIQSSMEFDCSTDHFDWPKFKPGKIWLREEVASLEDSLKRYEEEWMKEQLRVAGRNQWIKALRDSVPYPMKNQVKKTGTINEGDIINA